MKRKATKRARPAKERAPKEKAASTVVEARRAAARERYRVLKEEGGKDYERMLEAARARAGAYHERRKAAAEATRSGVRRPRR
jgi:hypothetical protein